MHKVIALTIALSAVLLGSATAQNMGMMPPPGGNALPTITPNYFLASQVDWIPLLPAPPKAGSAEQQRDLQGVLEAQASARKNPTRRQQAMRTPTSVAFISLMHWTTTLPSMKRNCRRPPNS
jgi:hypothetical protein